MIAERRFDFPSDDDRQLLANADTLRLQLYRYDGKTIMSYKLSGSINVENEFDDEATPIDDAARKFLGKIVAGFQAGDRERDSSPDDDDEVL